MEKKSDMRLLASGPAPGFSSSSPSSTHVTSPWPPVRPPSVPPITPPPPPVEDDWDGDWQEAIFRPRHDAEGRLVVDVLPPTLNNLTHPKEEDDVSQGNRHYRTLDPVDDILRRKLERKRPGVGVFSELIFYWPNPKTEPSCPDVCVVEGLKRPAAEIENSFYVADEGVGPCLVFEIVSATYKSTRDKDYEFNPRHYALAGVRELVLVEPITKGSPRIRQILALELFPSGAHREILPDASGRILLSTVGICAHVEAAAVVLEDAVTGERFLTSWEEEEAREAAERRAEDEATARQAEATARRDAERRAEDEATARQAEATARRDAERQAAQAMETMAQTLLTLLENRGLPPSDDERRRILACRDPEELQSRFDRALRGDPPDSST